MKQAAATNERVIVCTSGLPGTGKSTISRALSHYLGAPLVTTASTRVGWAPSINTLDTRLRNWSASYEAVFNAVDVRLDCGDSVVVDGTFGRRWQRDGLGEVARRHNVQMIYLVLRCSKPTALRRIDADIADRAASVENRTRTDYVYQEAHWEPITSLPGTDRLRTHIVEVDTELGTAVEDRTNPSSESLKVVEAVATCLRNLIAGGD